MRMRNSTDFKQDKRKNYHAHLDCYDSGESYNVAQRPFLLSTNYGHNVYAFPDNFNVDRGPRIEGSTRNHP